MWSSSHSSQQISDYLDYHSSINPTWKSQYFAYSEMLLELETSDLEVDSVDFDIQNRFRKGSKDIVTFYRTMLKRFRTRLLSFASWSEETKEFKPFQGLSNTRDDLKMAFVDLYQDSDLLLSWAQINMHAFFDALRAYNNITGGETFDIEYLELEPFSCCRGIHELQKRIEIVFSQEFKRSSKEKKSGLKKRQLIKQSYQQLRRKKRKHSSWDIVKLAVCLGISLPWIMLSIYVTFYPSPPVYRYRSFWNSFPIFRLTFLLVFYIFLLGFDTYIWRYFKINHGFLFQFQMKSKMMDYIHILKVASFYSIVWSTMFFLFLSTDKGVVNIFGIEGKYYVLVCVLGFLFLFLLPFHFFHYQARLTLVETIVNLLITPFGKSRFREHFVADVISSLVIPLQDSVYTFCYYVSGAWKSHYNINTCDGDIWMGIYGTIISIFPYFWRLCQSVRHAIEYRQHFQLFNASKYILAILLLIINSLYRFLISEDDVYGGEWSLLRITLFISWIILLFVTCIGSFIWDVHIDWGLFHLERIPPQERKTFFRKWCLPLNITLFRDRRRFHVVYYILSIIYNLIARFAWGLTLSYHLVGNNHDFLKMIFAAMEILRRANWSVIRLEWAQESNSLRYRKYTFVPKVFEMHDDDINFV